MFDGPATLDEIGIGQIRDAFSDMLFPGTSTVHTRARYLLLVPWSFVAAARTSSGAELAAKARRSELEVIKALQGSAQTGVIGAAVGTAIKDVPSNLYWSALKAYGILRSGKPRTGLRQVKSASDEPDWNMPIEAPSGFPRQVDGLDLLRSEAVWLRDRITHSVPGTYLTHLLRSKEFAEFAAPAPWDHAALDTASPAIREQVDHAELFSTAIHGAQLLYNLMLAEQFADEFAERIDDPDYYRQALVDWTAETQRIAQRLTDWNRGRFWDIVLGQNPRVSIVTQQFVDTWLDVVVRNVTVDPDSPTARRLIADREYQTKGSLARLRNRRQLGNWRGASAPGALHYRWDRVNRLTEDIFTGVDRASS
ncbi:DUF6361 family protein [Tsukamurella soli]|uniref:DUF6361 family protein n=2 Tax=Tsukamurella soli TaxID=644556 RepID=A0ABP8K2L8_9ACTN